MIGSIEDAVRVAHVAAQNALDQLGGSKPRAIIVFNCIARNKLFGQRSGEEISAIQKLLEEMYRLSVSIPMVKRLL